MGGIFSFLIFKKNKLFQRKKHVLSGLLSYNKLFVKLYIIYGAWKIENRLTSFMPIEIQVT